MMPPPGVRRPPTAEYIALRDWLETEIDRSARDNPGAKVLHRLNRTEYANAIRDLLALEIDPATLLLADDSSRGFDNIAGSLTISPTLVETYVTAATKIARIAAGYWRMRVQTQHYCSDKNWVAQADRDAGKRSDGLRTEEHEEIRRLRRENRQLREEREILAKATAWFARETGPGRSTGS